MMVVKRIEEVLPDGTIGTLYESSSPRVGANDATPKRSEWPEPLAPEAFHGPAGDFVRTVEPHTEADEAGLLVQMLVGFGNLIGRSGYFYVEAKQHYGNLFCVLVGESSKSRKGTSWSHVRRILESIDPQWTDACIQTGLSSGEGLIWAVRDPIERCDCVKEKGRPPRYETVIADQGISDKRLLVVESEFSSPLRVANREGNTLNDVVRQAFDDGHLRNLTKNSPAKATNAHISIMQSIFSPAAWRQRMYAGRERSRSRAGELKMDWTKPLLGPCPMGFV